MEQNNPKKAHLPDQKKHQISRHNGNGFAVIALVLIILFGIVVSGGCVSNSPPADTCNGQGGTCTAATTTAIPTTAEKVKSSQPTVELYVMSFCPYGVQAENAFRPVAELLKDSADIRVRYITTFSGAGASTTVRSLHGNAEAVEDIRQLCIAKYAPEKYWPYLSMFNSQCYPVWNDAGKLGACQKNVSATLGIPADLIDTCSSGSEGLGLLRADSASAGSSGATASPTLLIDGQRYTGARTPEAFKQAICSHFTTAPSACGTGLSANASSASGSC